MATSDVYAKSFAAHKMKTKHVGMYMYIIRVGYWQQGKEINASSLTQVNVENGITKSNSF